MLITKIRTGIKSPFSRGLLLIILLALFGGMGLLHNLMNRKTAQGIIWINKEEISKAAFENSYNRTKNYIDAIYSQISDKAMAKNLLQQIGIGEDLNAYVLNSLVKEALLHQAALKIPLYISSDFIKEKMSGSQDQSMVEPVGKQIKGQLLQEIIQTSLWVPNYFVNDAYQVDKVAKKFTIVTLPIDHFIKVEDEKNITNDELKKFFETNKNKLYSLSAKRSGKMWIFDAEKFSVEVSENEIEEYYKKNKHTKYIDAKAQIKIREIRFDDLKEKGLNQLSNEAHLMLAELTTNPAVFEKKGKVSDFFSRGTKEESLERAAFSLKNDGDISSVIDLQGKGFAIIQRVARKDATYKTLVQVSDEIKKTLLKQKFSKEFQAAASRVVRAEGENAEEQFTNFVHKNNGKQEVVKPQESSASFIASRLFSLKKTGNRLSFMHQGKGYIVELSGITTKSILPFDFIIDQVKKDYIREKANKELLKAMIELKKQSLQSKTLKIPSYGKAQKTEWLEAHDQAQLKKFADQGIPLDFMYLSKKGGIITSVGKKDGFIISLDEFKAVDVAKEEKDKKEVKSSLIQELKRFMGQAFIATLYRNAKIDTSKSLDMGRDSDEI